MGSRVIYTRAPPSMQQNRSVFTDDGTSSMSSTLPPEQSADRIAAPHSSYERRHGYNVKNSTGHMHDGGMNIEQRHHMMNYERNTMNVPREVGHSVGSSPSNRSERSINRPVTRFEGSYEEIYTEEDHVNSFAVNSENRTAENTYEFDAPSEEYNDYADDDDDEEEEEEGEDEDDEDVPRIAIIGGRGNNRVVHDILYGTPRAGGEQLSYDTGRHQYPHSYRHHANIFDDEFSDLDNRRYNNNHNNNNNWVKAEQRVVTCSSSQKSSPRKSRHRHGGDHYPRARQLSLTEKTTTMTETGGVVRVPPQSRHHRAARRSPKKSRGPHKAEPFAAEPDWTPARGEFNSATERSSAADEEASQHRHDDDRHAGKEREHRQASKTKAKRRRPLPEIEESDNDDYNKKQQSPLPAAGPEVEVKKKKKSRKEKEKKSKRKRKVDHAGEEVKEVASVFSAEEIVPPVVRNEKVRCFGCIGNKEKEKKEKKEKKERKGKEKKEKKGKEKKEKKGKEKKEKKEKREMKEEKEATVEEKEEIKEEIKGKCKTDHKTQTPLKHRVKHSPTTSPDSRERDSETEDSGTSLSSSRGKKRPNSRVGNWSDID